MWIARDRESPYRHTISKCEWNAGNTKQAESDRTDSTEEYTVLLSLYRAAATWFGSERYNILMSLS